MCSRADISSTQLMMNVFNHFSETSRLQANMDKSSKYIAGVPQEEKEHIPSEMRFVKGEHTHLNILEYHCLPENRVFVEMTHRRGSET